MLLGFIHFLFVLVEDTLNLQALRADGGSQKQKYIIYAFRDLPDTKLNFGGSWTPKRMECLNPYYEHSFIIAVVDCWV